jgi:hypothetical protein
MADAQHARDEAVVELRLCGARTWPQSPRRPTDPATPSPEEMVQQMIDRLHPMRGSA